MEKNTGALPSAGAIVEAGTQNRSDNVAFDTRLNRKHGRRRRHDAKKPTIPALNTVRGFTPSTSGDDDSDFSEHSVRISNRYDLKKGSSGGLNFNLRLRSSSPCPGISALTQQIQALESSPNSSQSSIAQKSDGPRVDKDCKQIEESHPATTVPCEDESLVSAANGKILQVADNDLESKTTYEVKLEHNFVSSEIGQEASNRSGSDDNLVTCNVVRKMTATDFEPLRCLGKGTYGTVLLVKQLSTGRLYAQKQFRKASLTVQKQLIEQTKTERAILESVNRHPFVVKLYYAFQDQEKLYLILEYAQGGELFTRMLTERMFPEDAAAFYMAEMVSAIDHLHNTVGVIYRDLKPENCLLDAEGHLLLTDFGLSKVAVDGEYQCRSMTGTLEYMAPEVLLQKHYGQEVDWWSFGILGFDLLTGASPFHANNDSKVKEKILKSKLVLPYFLSLDAKDLLTRLLRKKPRDRLGAFMPKDLQTIKKHRFFRKIDWQKLENRELEPPIKPLVTDPELAENFSTDFTNLAVSPVQAHPKRAWGSDSAPDPFGGFSFVASRSLLTTEERLL
ncbi:MAG: hypothetical protein LQ351_002131 [Letrouitia transgressa]|nr:MAG: hypothetical protein LQ351_002131 [Letrouitia transgressa]